jgi:uncharacterized protein
MKCFYHSADLDGHCSGAIVKYAHPQVECIGIDYTDLFPWDRLLPGEEIWLVDFHLQPFSDMVRLNASHPLVWIDHHKTAIADAQTHDFRASGAMSLREDMAACELTWRFCFPGLPMPLAVLYLGRYDIWKHAEHPGALEFQYGMRLQPDTRPEQQELWQLFFTTPGRTRGLVAQSVVPLECEVKTQGAVILEYERVTNAKVCAACAFPVTLDGLRCIAVNRPLSNSLAFASVWDQERYDAMVAFYCKRPGQWVVSLFTDKPGVDVSLVCKARGGGGHTGAAGFTCAVLPDVLTCATAG